MSTRSTIAIELGDGSVKKVYCHYDGYVSHVGKALAEHYNNHASWYALCHGPDIRGFDYRFDGKVCVHTRFDRPEDKPMFPDAYPDYAAYVASIDHVFHECNYIMRKDGSMEVIYGDTTDPTNAKPKSLNRCVGQVKAKETKKVMSE